MRYGNGAPRTGEFHHRSDVVGDEWGECYTRFFRYGILQFERRQFCQQAIELGEAERGAGARGGGDAFLEAGCRSGDDFTQDVAGHVHSRALGRALDGSFLGA